MTYYPLATETWNDDEINAIQQVIDSGRFSMGPMVKAFEERAAQFFGTNYAVMVNSGSSANLLAVAGLCYHPDYNINPGDNVIVPSVSWSTTFFPVSQYGLELRFVDVDLHTLNIDCNLIENAIDEHTKAIFAVNLLGNPADLIRLKEICDRNNLVLIEDNCESMGAKLKNQMAGTFGLCGTLSMFFSHHISTMEGGLILTNDRKLRDICVSMRAHGWLREQNEDSHLNFDCDPFSRQFRFVLPGYNLRPLEMSGAIGLKQLDKLSNFVQERRNNAQLFQQIFGANEDLIIQKEHGESSWFGFSMILGNKLAGRRDEVVKALAAQGIETRPIVAGNFTANPVIKHLKHSFGSSVGAAEKIDLDGFFLGNHHYPIERQLECAHKVLSGM
ncbi:DegT/DnrJ/EryC1/StrS family aminotransferase [Pseudovibrio sp. SPO723]|uniref:DegT/DnrJ/EryC1/StrS family aminotransferase n=1 Tax=Nesiotobacter zosterae TaxID=392721 RepID=UPI0029C40852|nr:DegT/DnrJ/EryC1/StrS family aminotransferase [Pseudovibrio sp. SPO723]MDX5593349.1 DegT/DnrJ/EryC1/StrS family aminotransferase [Pseudovibrio sp. SPO723]